MFSSNFTFLNCSGGDVVSSARIQPNFLMFATILPATGRRPFSMEEKRKFPRTEISEPAYVSSGGSVMSCVVRNISAEGAAIDVETPTFVHPPFRLVMASDSSVY